MFARIRGKKIYFDRVGEGTPLLMLHGVTTCGLLFAGQLLALQSTDREVILPDLMGIGKSEPIRAVRSVSEHADDMASLMDDLSIASADVVGVSLGGMVTQELALRHPSRLKRAIVVAAPPSFNGEAAERTVAGWVRMLSKPQGIRMRHEATWPKLVGENYRNSPQGRSFNEALVAGLVHSDARSAINIAQGMLSFDVMARLSSVRLPLTVLRGELDQMVSPESCRRIAERVPAARYLEIEGGGHLVNLDAPDTFNRQLLALLPTQNL